MTTIVLFFQIKKKKRLRKFLYITKVPVSGKLELIWIFLIPKFVLLFTAPVDNIYLPFLHVKESMG